MMLLWKLLPFSRRVAFVYLVVICLLFILHFKIADEFTYKHVKNYADEDNHSITTKSQPSSGTRTADVFFESVDGNKSNEPTRIKETNDNNGDVDQLLYTPPEGEDPKRRYPQCVIIGFTKTGTRALIEFMALHPYIQVARNEVHFYDKDENFEKGYGWYREQMPLSYSNQITVEKTPAYILTKRARDEMFKMTPYVNLIALVRDPVVRLVSQYLLKYRFSTTPPPLKVIYTNTTTGLFDPEMRPVDIGNYQKHIGMWIPRFSLRRLLILNSEDLTRDPVSVMKKVEQFLEIPALFSDRNVYYNATSGFNCPRGFEPNSQPRCLGKTKGLVHPNLSPEDERMLYDYYKPYNEKLFKLLGYRINWDERKWRKET